MDVQIGNFDKWLMDAPLGNSGQWFLPEMVTTSSSGSVETNWNHLNSNDSEKILMTLLVYIFSCTSSQKRKPIATNWYDCINHLY